MITLPVTPSTSLRLGMVVTWTDRRPTRAHVYVGTVVDVTIYSQNPRCSTVKLVFRTTGRTDRFFLDTLCSLNARFTPLPCPKKGIPR